MSIYTDEYMGGLRKLYGHHMSRIIVTRHGHAYRSQGQSILGRRKD